MNNILPQRLDWPSAIGNFLLNYGTLHWHLLVFLEKRLPADEFDRIKVLHFRDCIEKFGKIMAGEPRNPERDAQFTRFFNRIESVRKLRNHIAHGHLRLLTNPETKQMETVVSLPKNLDESEQPQIFHLRLDELLNCLSELAGLIEEFTKMDGGWSETIVEH